MPVCHLSLLSSQDSIKPKRGTGPGVFVRGLFLYCQKKCKHFRCLIIIIPIWINWYIFCLSLKIPNVDYNRYKLKTYLNIISFKKVVGPLKSGGGDSFVGPCFNQNLSVSICISQSILFLYPVSESIYSNLYLAVYLLTFLSRHKFCYILFFFFCLQISRYTKTIFRRILIS